MSEHIGSTTRISSQIKKVPFGNSFAFKVESIFLKAEIAKGVLSSLLPFSEGFEVLESQFPKEPINGFLDVAFEWILRYTYVQHNYLLFCYRVPKRFDCKDISTVQVLSRECIVMINKYTQEMYLVNFRFSEQMFEGTLLDGILLKDNCVYPDYFESTYTSSLDHIDSDIPSHLMPMYNKFVAQSVQTKVKGGEYTFNPTREIYFRDQPEYYLYYSLNFPPKVIDIFSMYYNPVRNQVEESQPKEKVVVTDIKDIWNNYKEITKTIDFSTVFKQTRLPSQYIFHIQAVYQLLGERVSYSVKKLVDSISYNTLLNIQQKMFQTDENWIKDEWIEPFSMENSIDTMYYTRHTQVDLRNPFHNDYLRYHPQLSPNRPNSEIEYEHFIPEMTPKGELWKNIYTLGKQLVECTLSRTKYPYVYSLVSKDKRVKADEFARVCTLEGRRYIRVILNKIHSDKTKPLRIKCRAVIHRATKQIEGWIPVKYDAH